MPSVSRAERRVKLCRRRRPWALASSRDELRHSILDHPDRARAPPRTPPESIAGGVRTGGEGGSRGPRRAAGTRTVVTPPHTSTATWRRSSIQRVQRIQTGGARRTGFTISGTIQTNHPPRRAAMAPRRGPQSRDPGPRAGQPGWSPAAARSGPLLDRVQQGPAPASDVRRRRGARWSRACNGGEVGRGACADRGRVFGMVRHTRACVEASGVHSAGACSFRTDG